MSSPPALFMKHDCDMERLPSVDNTRDNGHRVERLPPSQQGSSDTGNTSAPKISSSAASSLAPVPLTQKWNACKAGDGMHVCRAMLDHISIMARSESMHDDPISCWGQTTSIPMPSPINGCLNKGIHQDSIDIVKASSRSMHWFGSELQDLKDQMTSLESLLLASLENGRGKDYNCVKQRRIPDIGCDTATLPAPSKVLGLSTAPDYSCLQSEQAARGKKEWQEL